MVYLPHDLIRLHDVTELKDYKQLPDWAQQSLKQAPVVVVRRGPITADGIPVGIRGAQKAERAAALLAVRNDYEIVHPKDLVRSQKWQLVAQNRQQLPVFRALKLIFPVLAPYEWGIGGSCGYELVTGVPMVNNASDLDVIVTHFPEMTVQEANGLLQNLNQFDVHVDLQVTQGQNGFSLEEYANHRSETILVKTVEGPQLVSNPWQAIREK
ncbi:malonate decarboxylase holo-ACP synthase [Pediococcus siamensis]|uniref:malonate decarboxylase holo-ACP synthase n=1 Tax=Pediococcus siamensis TaxID=381829 RepID=UPI0039A025EA